MRDRRIARPLSASLVVFGLIVFGAFFGGRPASAETQVMRIGDSTITLTGPWKFHVGDSPVDPATRSPLWANASFDDSGWEAVDLAPDGRRDPVTGDPRYVPGWASRGHPNYGGYAWYRLQVRVEAPAGTELAFATYGLVEDGYQIFADGKLLGSWGDFSNSKDPTVYFTQPATFSVLRASGAPQEVTIALRFWKSPVRLYHHPFAGGLHYAPLLGKASAIHDAANLELMKSLRANAARPFDAALSLLIAIIVASLFFFDRSDPVYPLVAAVILIHAVYEATDIVANFTRLVSFRMIFVELSVFTLPLTLGIWGMVWWFWFHRRPAWVGKALVIGTLVTMVCTLPGGDLLYEIVPHQVSAVFDVLSLPCRLFLICMMLVIVWYAVKEQGREGWLVTPVVALLVFSYLQGGLSWVHFYGTLNVHGVVLYYPVIGGLVDMIAISVLLIRRLLMSLRRRREVALDIKHAQELQQVILPEARTVLPGLVIESEYRPAREVGGDFFQIIPNKADGSLLIVAGDVTGKGLKAGMLVALLVGAARSSAEESDDPRRILEALNRRLVGRSDAQATCLALRIAKDGRVDLANAGHLAPYLNGVPLEMEGALPLGMIENLEPSSMQFQLRGDDRLVLVSDGLAEATNGQRELFGFERLRELVGSSSNASEVAAVAQAFGQEDDISVIWVTRTAELVPA